MIEVQKIFQEIEKRMKDLPPSRLNFKIGETAQFTGVSNSVLRYWEKEFQKLCPKKFSNGQRLYFKKDIETLLLIKALLYEEKFSIEGLRKHLPLFLQKFRQSKQAEKSPLLVEASPPPIKGKVHKLLSSISKMRSELSKF